MELSLFDSQLQVSDAVANAERARAAGLHTYWTNQTSSLDPVATLAVVASQVPDIGIGTAVIALQTTLAQLLAQQCLTLSQVSDGRFTLGLGVNHEPVVTNMWGLSWGKPYTHMVEYLDALLPLLTEQRVSTEGTFVTHRTQINVPAPVPQVMLAALGPKMLGLAADRTAGTITWMTGPRTITEHIRPVLGDAGRIVAGVAAWVTDDIDAARDRCNRALAIYGQLPSYRAVLDREGATEPADLVLIGDVDTVRAGLDRYADAGTDEVAVSLMGRGDDLEAGWQAIEMIAAS